MIGLEHFYLVVLETVKIDHCLSSASYVKSGVPHCSVLGPILFLIYIYIYKLSFSEHVAIKLYDSDTKLYSSSIHYPYGSALLQSGVNSIIEWSST